MDLPKEEINFVARLSQAFDKIYRLPVARQVDALARS